MPSPRELTLALTLGDPAGIGPEVALRAARSVLRGDGRRTAPPRLLLIGDVEATREAAARLRAGVEVRPCTAADLADPALFAVRSGRRLALPVLPPPGVVPLRPRERRPGSPSVAGARVAHGAIVLAVDLARRGHVDALCTAPINKEWFARAGVARTGHTEILAELSGAPRVRLMMVHGDLRVVLATTHLALRDVPAALDIEGVRDTVLVAARHVERWFGIARPRVAVAGLNPHASDGGVYGDEEARVIAPAVRRARAAGVDAIGPIPADTLFSAIGPRCDAVVAMYHDQGLIPVKQLGVHEAVNVTLGLPFVRTSPDHGTAYDLAGTGRADPRSMQAALLLALELARTERRRSRRPRPRRAAPAA